MRDDIYLIQMGMRIKAIRKAKRITQDRLSRLCGIDESNICLLECGKRNVHILTLKSIADVLKVDVKDFI
jgi:transcriptional regulator with XRE-family HTH domain